MKPGKQFPKFGFLDSIVHIRQTLSDSNYYFEYKGETKGFIRKTPLGWLWCYNTQAMRFGSISELLTYAAEKIENA